MKAAVMYPGSGLPKYTDYSEPVPANDGELLVAVKAVAIKHFDKSKASGKHYSTDAPSQAGRTIGGDGIFLLADGTRAYAMGVSGTMAEKATVNKKTIVKVPDGLDDATASALPNAVAGAAMGLKFKARIQPGDVVLINGATGFTGRMAVQIARHYGARKVIVTGRNQQSLHDLLTLGADEAISLLQEDAELTAKFQAVHADTPIDIVIDYLWGHTAELILACLKGNGEVTNQIRYVSIGSMGGDLIQLSAANLRSVDLQLTGSGLGAWSKAQIGEFFSQILPEMFLLAADGQLKADIVTVNLENIADLWDLDVAGGQRLVVMI